MLNPFVGEISQVAFDWAPKDWAICNGAVIPIEQNQTLFSLIGSKFGGNIPSTFALPDARGRALIGTGQLTYGEKAIGGFYNIGDKAGYEATALTTSQMPKHTHNIYARSGVDTASLKDSPNNMLFANTDDPKANGTPLIYAPADVAPNVMMAVNSISVSGDSQPVSRMQPYLALTTIIALTGVLPEKST